MIKLPFYGNKKLRLAFEYGVAIADVAKENGVSITPELIKRAEEIIVSEFSQKSATKVACEMVPNLLAVFETN